MKFAPEKRLFTAFVFLALLFCSGHSHASGWLKKNEDEIVSLRKDSSREARVKLVFLLHVQSKYTAKKEPIYQEIRDILSEFKRPYGPLQAEIPLDNLHAWDKTPDDYDPVEAKKQKQELYSGDDEDIVNFFWSEVSAWPVPDIDCRWLEKSPGMFALHQIIGGGGSSARPLANITCEGDPKIPTSVYVLRNKLGKQFHQPWQVTGTIGASHAAYERFKESELVYAPQRFLTDEPGLTDKYRDSLERFRSAPFLESWGMYSLWNFHTGKQYAAEFEQAVRDLAQYYSGLPQFNGIPRKRVALTARNALKNYLFAYDKTSYATSTLPAFQGVRWSILHGVSASMIKRRFNRCLDVESRRLDELTDNIRSDAAIGTPEPLSFLAVERPDVLAVLFECGSEASDTNALGKTLLMNAAHFGALDGAKMILERTPVEMRKNFINMQSNPPYTSETYLGDISAVNIKHGQRTALMYAAENASAKFIDWLLEQGADACLKDSGGLTALDYMEGRNPAAFTNPHLKKAERVRLKKKLACAAAR